jgi:hypothetical protein
MAAVIAIAWIVEHVMNSFDELARERVVSSISCKRPEFSEKQVWNSSDLP